MRKYCSHIWIAGGVSMVFGATFPILCEGRVYDFLNWIHFPFLCNDRLYFPFTAFGWLLFFTANIHYARTAKTRFLMETFWGLGLTNFQDEIIVFIPLEIFKDHDPSPVNISEYILAIITICVTFRRYKLRKEVWEKSLR